MNTTRPLALPTKSLGYRSLRATVSEGDRKPARAQSALLVVEKGPFPAIQVIVVGNCGTRNVFDIDDLSLKAEEI
ncbi:MAG: hypothetical protein WC661_09550 [Opitutaceae bacterium]|jgi:hypothetical protein